MKIQCDKCREIVAFEFELATTGIDVTCPACKQTYFVAAASRPRATPALPLGFESTCPKCGEAQPRAEACRKCGLVFAKWRGVEALADGDEPDLEGAREASALFAACEEKWDDPARHDAFIAHCRRTGTFGFAAARYRGALARSPDDAVAAARVKQIRALAEFVLRVPEKAGAREPTPYRGTIIVLTIAVAICIAGAIFFAYFGFPGLR